MERGNYPRDLRAMEEQGLLCRVFGGAYLSDRVKKEVLSTSGGYLP
jgi:DeoR/GlpR family transcriptional regulator of sugar metabolism